LDELKLLQLAREVIPLAYAPYSEYKVGAALLTSDGRVFRGVNVENSSLGLTICAERAALAAAIAAGCRSFSMIAIVSEDESGPWPCGACRQVLSEFCDENLKVVVSGKKGEIRRLVMKDLFPYPFIFDKEKLSQEK
jgi:cytidine deaminase